MKKYLSLFLCLIAVIALVITGCGGTHGHSSDAADNNPPIPYELKADGNGAIDAPIGSTGLRFKAEAGTFEPDTRFIFTVSDSSEGSSNDYLVASTKVYDIKSYLEGTTGSTDILSTEKPVIITLPNDIPGAAEYYFATRASSDSGWNFALITDNNSESNPMNASARMVRAAYGSEFYIALHNLKQQFALFAHKDSSVTPKKAIITAIDCEAPDTLKEKDGKYVEDLKVDVVLSANNASQLKSSDIVLKYNYQNGNSKDAAITATAASLKNTSDGQAKAGSGNKYAHSFELSNFDKFSVSGDKISISFILNMTGVAVEEFAENYYIEVCGINKDAFELLPGCSCNMTLKSGSDEPSKTDITVSSTFADKIDAEIKPSVEITFDNAINWSDVCTKYVTMTKDGDTAAIAYSAAYDSNRNVLTIIPENNLAYGTKYNVLVSKDMPVPENYQIKVDFTFSFTTAASKPSKTDITVSSTFADKKDAEIKPSVEIAFDNAINWSDVCTKYVTMTKDGDTAAIAYGARYDSNKNVLTITPENNLAYGTKYNVVVSKNMPVPENYQITEDYTFSFATVAESEYTLTVSKGTGIATVSEGGSYKADTEITLEYTLETGYEFDLWVSSEVTVDENNKFIMPSKDVNVTANAKIITYKISYDGLDGAVTNPVTYDVTSATITLNNPTKAGYTFKGWSGTDLTGDENQTVTIPQGSTGDRAYTANWRTMASVMTFTLPGGIELEMRRCPAGSFDRSGRKSYCDNKTVTISKDFYMGTYEVTNAQYAAIMGSSPSSGGGADFTGDKQPVVYVSWNDIMTDSTGFISKLNAKLTETGQLPSGYKFALPTEAQWEYACRAGTTTDLNSSKDIENDEANDPNTNEVAWYWQNWGETYRRTHVVGGRASNSFGLYDMHGNVWEWCADWYGGYSSTNLTDPTGPTDGSYRVVRGGCWGSDPFYCASWYRGDGDPGGRYCNYGFRLALVPVQE